MSYAVLHPEVKTAANIRTASSFAEMGTLEVRLANNEAEIHAAQALRYKIFYQELGATPTPEMAAAGRDFDRFDDVCDHLLVIDRAKSGIAAIVGTYRLMRENIVGGADGFYSNQEYDLSPLFTDHFRNTMMPGRQLLELGRSCVDVEYRSNSTIHLLWRGIAIYTLTHNIGYMFGCASLAGTDPTAHAMALSYLYHEFSIPEAFRVRAQPHRFHDMNMIPKDKIDVRAARRALPPLVKGYLRLGCYIGDGAVVDEQWGSTDIFILLPVERITHRYSQHFELTDMTGDQILDPFSSTNTLRII